MYNKINKKKESKLLALNGRESKKVSGGIQKLVQALNDRNLSNTFPEEKPRRMQENQVGTPYGDCEEFRRRFREEFGDKPMICPHPCCTMK